MCARQQADIEGFFKDCLCFSASVTNLHCLDYVGHAHSKISRSSVLAKTFVSTSYVIFTFTFTVQDYTMFSLDVNITLWSASPIRYIQKRKLRAAVPRQRVISGPRKSSFVAQPLLPSIQSYFYANMPPIEPCPLDEYGSCLSRNIQNSPFVEVLHQELCRARTVDSS